jgi:hypothetical protein
MLMVKGNIVEIFGVKVEAITKIIRELAITAVVVIIAYKLLSVNPSFDFTKLSATDLVALILAIFAVGLSAAFYFAASNSSAKFYDNMHKFTKDTSVVLGQLTEQMKGLDKRQQEVKETFERQYSNNSNGDNDSAVEVEAKELKVNEVREDLKNSVEGWLENFQIDAKEKERIKNELAEKEALLSESVTQLSNFKAEIREESARKIRGHIHYKMRKARDRDLDAFEDVAEFVLSGNPGGKFKVDLERAGFIVSPEVESIGGLTEEGLSVLSKMYERVFDN